MNGLVITDRNANLFQPHNWLAGVRDGDVPQTQTQDEEEEEEEEEQEDDEDEEDEEEDDQEDEGEYDEENDEDYEQITSKTARNKHIWARQRDYQDDMEVAEEELYDPVTREELEELFADDGRNATRGNDIQQVDDAQTAGVDDSTDSESEEEFDLRRSTRVTRQPVRLTYGNYQGKERKVSFDKKATNKIEQGYNLITTEETKTIEYSPVMAQVAARTIVMLKERVRNIVENFEKIRKGDREWSFAQQYILQAGLKKFGIRGREAVKKEFGQLHHRVCFRPIDVSTLTKSEKEKAQKALVFLTEKRDKTIKARTVYDGSKTREWHNKEDTASPTVSLEGLFLTAVVDAKEERDVMTCDIPNAFIQTDHPEPQEGED
jgi:hypothetical protein